MVTTFVVAPILAVDPDVKLFYIVLNPPPSKSFRIQTNSQYILLSDSCYVGQEYIALDSWNTQMVNKNGMAFYKMGNVKMVLA